MSTVTSKVAPLPAHLETPHQAQFAVRLLALAVAAFGLLNLWSALLAKGPGRARFLIEVVQLPIPVEHASRTLITLFGLFLLTLARSLAHRKRQAWRITMIILGFTPFFHIAKGLDYEEALICIALMLILFMFRSLFWAENDQPSARQGVAAAAGLFLFSIFYGPVGFVALRHDFRPHVTIQRAIDESVRLITFESGRPYLWPATMRAHWFEDSLVFISAVAAAYAVIMLLRPVLPRDRSDDLQRIRARWMLSRWGGLPISYFALMPDKRYLFSSSSDQDDWCVAYRVVGRRAVALGDPIGNPAKAEEAIKRYVSFCRVQDWQPSFYQVGTDYLDLYQKAGLKTLKVGQDSCIDLTSFSLRGKTFQDLRTSLNKMAKLGIEIEHYNRGNEMSNFTITELSAVSSEWLQARHGVEKSFAMGSFAPQTELFEDSRIFIARDKLTRIVLGFVTFVPIFGPSEMVFGKTNIRGWALDLMRRRSDAINGIMEFLITSAALQFQSEGAEEMTLGLSALAETDKEEDDPHDVELFVRARQILFKRFNFTYSFDGLFSFKNKFGPSWQSRYLAYDGHATLLSTIYAILEAHSRRFLILRLKNMLTRLDRKQERRGPLPKPSAS